MTTVTRGAGVGMCALAGLAMGVAAGSADAGDDPSGRGSGGPGPIQVSFLWHMHQPRYVPGESIFGADPFFSFSVVDVHNSRVGPYTTWPRDAVQSGSFLPNLGAHVSFSGSLMQNLDELEGAGVNGGMWNNWEGAARAAQSSLTQEGNRRLDMVGFGFHHPLMPLIDERSIRRQIQLHRHAHQQRWGVAYPDGMFPPETAFSTRMIPALAAEGIGWIMVDNIHFDRATLGYPHTDATGIAAPNRADQINPNPEDSGGRWVQLQNLWAPSRVSVPFGYQPHLAQHIDPATGAVQRIVAVPAARYEGNEDGRGGYGAFLYDQVMDAYLPDNNAADRPMLVLLHHDGDNFGGGSQAYYGSNFQSMVGWVADDPDYNVSTVDDYLDRFPVPGDAVIHVEDGSWAGADSGDPEFKKWLGGDTSAGAVNPDVNSWAAIVAATNHVHELEDALGGFDAAPVSNANMIAGTGSRLERAWHALLTGQASDYWYWDGTEVWDSNATRASNAAVAEADAGIAQSPAPDATAPTVFVPQREPYNPGSVEFGTVQPRDFEVWTLAYDRAGLSQVTLRWRVDLDGANPLSSTQNETYAGGDEVGPWNSVPMTGAAVPTPPGVLAATRKATRYGAMITGQSEALIDYYVEATDNIGNVARSPIMHVWVGDGTGGDDGGGTPGDAAITPDPAVAGQPVAISYDAGSGVLSDAPAVFLHYGFDGWATVPPDVTMIDPDGDGVWTTTVGVPSSAASLQMVFNDGAGAWDNNNGQDWSFGVDGAEPVDEWTVDGTLDDDAIQVTMGSGLSLWAGIKGGTLYVAATPAGAGLDRFLLVADQPGAMVPAMWGKAGRVAAWSAFVGNEESNGWAGWTDAVGGQVAGGSVVEATLDLGAQFGAVPESIALALASYASADGGALNANAQLPASVDGDGDVDVPEYLVLNTCELILDPGAGCCVADFNGDGAVNVLDVVTFITVWNGAGPGSDFNGDGAVNVLDVVLFIGAWSEGC